MDTHVSHIRCVIKRIEIPCLCICKMIKYRKMCPIFWATRFTFFPYMCHSLVHLLLFCCFLGLFIFLVTHHKFNTIVNRLERFCVSIIIVSPCVTIFNVKRFFSNVQLHAKLQVMMTQQKNKIHKQQLFPFHQSRCVLTVNEFQCTHRANKESKKRSKEKN